MGKRKDPEYPFAFGPEEFAAWWDRAACITDPNPDHWHAEGVREAWKVERARSVCAVCPVSDRCYQYAMSHPEVEGMWGGFTSQERRVAQRAKALPQLSAVERMRPLMEPGETRTYTFTRGEWSEGEMCPKGLHDMSRHGLRRWSRTPDGTVWRSGGTKCGACRYPKSKQAKGNAA